MADGFCFCEAFSPEARPQLRGCEAGTCHVGAISRAENRPFWGAVPPKIGPPRLACPRQVYTCPRVRVTAHVRGHLLNVLHVRGHVVKVLHTSDAGSCTYCTCQRPFCKLTAHATGHVVNVLRMSGGPPPLSCLSPVPRSLSLSPSRSRDRQREGGFVWRSTSQSCKSGCQ